MPKPAPIQFTGTLLYGAVLGTALYDTYKSASGYDIISRTAEAFSFSPVISGCKLVLVLASLVFYTCDNINIYQSKKYGFGDLAVDALAGFIMLHTFKALRIEARVTDRSDYFRLDYLSLCFAAFMILYLGRYLLIVRKRQGSEKERLHWLAKLELLFALIFGSVFISHYFQLFTLEMLALITTLFVMAAATSYIVVLCRKDMA